MAHHDPIGLIAPHAGLAQLNERSRDIFRQIVESYLATGEPVGSRNISRLIAMPLSPASVRNVMSDLEALGLIYAPHTSAGRLPTELGLRFFVDALMQVGDLTEPERESIQSQLASVGRAQSVEAALGEALTRLSGLTRAAAGKQGGRTVEIQRLIGRSLRAAVDLEALGERQITVDCDVIQADGGTRTASITGAWVALADCISWMKSRNMIKANVLRDNVAAISCGIYQGTPVLDLDYAEDSEAETDANFVMTGDGRIIEVQGTAEKTPFSQDEFLALMALARKGVARLVDLQKMAVT